MKKDRLIKIRFCVNDRYYDATVNLHRPTAIIIPDQNIIAYTTISPKPDASSQKDRYRKTFNSTDDEEAKIDQRQKPHVSRTILKANGEINELKFTEYPKLGEPFICNYRYLTLAAPSPNLPY